VDCGANWLAQFAACGESTGQMPPQAGIETRLQNAIVTTLPCAKMLIRECRFERPLKLAVVMSARRKQL
jgi:hypothetical protein